MLQPIYTEGSSKTKLRPDSAKFYLPPAKYGNMKGQVRPQSAKISNMIKKKQSEYNHEYDEPIPEEEDFNPDQFPGQKNNFTHIDFNNLLTTPPLYSGENKRPPKNIKKDKEKLYEEVLDVKQLLNKIKEENIILKTRNLTLQKDNVKLEKLLENVEGFLQTGNVAHQPVQEHLVMNNFKKQMKELKNTLNDKNAELIQLKRNVKITKMEEMEAELKGYIEESIRLRSLLDQALRNQAAQKIMHETTHMEEKFYIQMKVINSLQQEIDNFQSLIKLKEEDLFHLQLRIEHTSQENIRMTHQVREALQSLEVRDKKIDALERETANAKNINNNLIIKASKAHHNELLIHELESKNEDFKKKFLDKEKQIELFEKAITDMKQNYAETYNTHERERKHLESEMERYKALHEHVDEKYKSNLYINATNTQPSKVDLPELKDIKKRQSIVKSDDLNILLKFKLGAQEKDKTVELVKEIEQESEIKTKQMTKRHRTVKYEDIKDIGLELNMRFRIKKLKLDQIIDQSLMDPIITQRGTISIKDIAMRLSNHPFDMIDVEQIYLVSRYMIEDNAQEWVDYDEDNQQNIHIVKSIFSKFVGKYKIFSEDDDARLRDEISSQIIKYKKSILSYFPTFNRQFLVKEQIAKAFNYMGLEFTPDAHEYFFLRLFELGGEKDVLHFDYKKILEEWGNDDRKNKKSEKKISSIDLKGSQSQQQTFNYGSKFTYEKG